MKTFRFNIWMGKFSILNLKEDSVMSDRKSEFSEALSDMSEYAGILAGTAIVFGKKVIRYVNNLTIVETHIKPPTEPAKRENEVKSKTH